MLGVTKDIRLLSGHEASRTADCHVAVEARATIFFEAVQYALVL